MVFEDKWKLPFFYPTKATGGLGTGPPFFYQQSDNITRDRNFNGEGDVTDAASGEWTFESDGPTSVQIFKNSDSAQSIGGCNMDFEETAKRKYGYKADDPRDIELKFLIKFEDSQTENGFAIEGPTGRHTGGGCCQGFAYKLDIDYLSNPAKFRFRKEMWHVSNHNDPKTGVWTHPKANFKLLGHDFVGLGYCHYVKKGGASSGHNTDDSVVLEAWFNPDPLANPKDWTLMKRTEDRGNWGDDGDECNGDPDQIGAWSNSNFRLKSNDEGGVFTLAHLSLREIDPTKSFDDDPDEPSEGPQETETIQGKFKLQWDLNSSRTSSCAGAGAGGAGGSAIFYEVFDISDEERSLSNHADHLNRTRIGQKCTSSGNSIYGKELKQLDVELMKVGTPGASPVISAKIWSSGSNTVRATSSTTVDPTTLSDASWTTVNFNFSANTYNIVAGDVIGVEYTGSSSSNYILTRIRNATFAAGCRANYEAGVWKEISSSEFNCRMWE